MVAKTVLVALALLCTMQTMEASIADDVQAGLDGVTKLISGVMDKVGDTMKGAAGMAQDVMGKIYQNMESMANGANKIGTDISECMTNAKDKLVPIAKGCEEKMISCGKNIMNDVKSDIGNMNSTVSSMMDKYRDEKKKVADCMAKSFFSLCPSEKAGLALKLGQMGIKMAPIVAKAATEIPVIVHQLTQCPIEATTYAKNEATPVITDTMKCVYQKISDATKGSPAADNPKPAESNPAPAESNPAPAESNPAPAESNPAPAEDKPADDSAAAPSS